MNLEPSPCYRRLSWSSSLEGQNAKFRTFGPHISERTEHFRVFFFSPDARSKHLQSIWISTLSVENSIFQKRKTIKCQISHFWTPYLGNYWPFSSFLFFPWCAHKTSSIDLNFNPFSRKLDFSEAKNDKMPNFALLDPISRELLNIFEFSFFLQMRAWNIFNRFEFQPFQSKTRGVDELISRFSSSHPSIQHINGGRHVWKVFPIMP